MKRRNLLVAACFLIYILIVILPPLIYHYVYPNNNDDTATLFTVMRGLLNHQGVLTYLGNLYVGYPLLFLSSLVHSSFYQVWLWFNLLILIPAGFVLYFVGSKLVDYRTGLLMLLIPVFVSGGIMSYQNAGIIFSLILMAILMPLLIYCVVRYLLEKRIYQLVLVIILAIITTTFHTTGLYVPLIAGLSLVVFVIYKLVKKEFTAKLLVLCLGVIGFMGLAVVALVLSGTKILSHVSDLYNAIEGQQNIATRQYSMPIWYLVTDFVSFSVVAIIGISLFVIVKNKVKLSNQVKLYLYFLSCWFVILVILGIGRLSVDPIRAEVDTSIVLAFIGTILFGVSLNYIKDKMIFAVVAIIMFAEMGGHLRMFLTNNSAVTQSDKEAIAYINTLDYSNYNCSSTLSYWIYDNLTKAQYSKDATGLIITRNKIMTPRSDKTFIGYWEHGVELDSSYTLVKSFVNNGVEVDVYEKY